MSYDGLSGAELAARLGTPSCLSLVRVTSTLDVVHELAADGAPECTVVIANEQVAGRGRQGRRWHSPAGTGVWLGYLLRPEHPIEAGVVSLRVGLAVVDALVALDASPQLKWPNDILLRDRKVAGVLCEARWSADRIRWIAIGIGLNVHGPLPASLRSHAIALDEVRPGVSRIAVLEGIVRRLHTLDHQAQLTPEERRAYRCRDWLIGKTLREPVVGVADGIDADGALRIATSVGTERVVGGTVVTA